MEGKWNEKFSVGNIYLRSPNARCLLFNSLQPSGAKTVGISLAKPLMYDLDDSLGFR